MNWFSLTIFASLLESFGVIYERYLLGHETKKTNILTSFWGYITAVFFISPILIYPDQLLKANLNPLVCLLGLLIGFLYFLAIFLYYSSINHNEVSRIVPLMALNPVFVLIFAEIFFHEHYSPNQYLGMSAILIGVLIASIFSQNHHKKSQQKLISWSAIILALSAALIFALKNILTKTLSLNNIPLEIITFWAGLGILISTILFTIWQKPDLQKITNRSAIHLFLAVSPTSLASLFFMIAITSGQVGLITFLGKTEILFVFILSQSIQFLKPKWLQEKLSPSIFGQKLLGISIILIGCYLLI